MKKRFTITVKKFHADKEGVDVDFGLAPCKGQANWLTCNGLATFDIELSDTEAKTLAKQLTD